MAKIPFFVFQRHYALFECSGFTIQIRTQNRNGKRFQTSSSLRSKRFRRAFHRFDGRKHLRKRLGTVYCGVQ